MNIDNEHRECEIGFRRVIFQLQFFEFRLETGVYFQVGMREKVASETSGIRRPEIGCRRDVVRDICPTIFFGTLHSTGDSNQH